MQIKEYGARPQADGLDGAYNTRDFPGPHTDATFFRSMLEQSGPPLTATAGASTVLSDVSRQLKASESRLTRALKSSSKGIEMDQFKEYPRELSNAVLTSQLLVKSLGKATQCIDKLSNLQ